ncbi:MAG: PAS domain S-box protein [Flavobacteriaceae bacterium]|nr:PAS domain S-box protein [Flavobacteriaceae bacterium]
MSEEKIRALEKALLRAKEARKQAEDILEKKSLELYETNQKLASTNKMMELLLDDKSAQMNIIFENSSLGIFLSSKGTLIETNHAIELLLGYTKEELNKLSISEVSHPNDLKYNLEFVDKLNSGEVNTFTGKQRYRKKDGTYILCKTHITNVKDGAGNVKYQVVILEDISLLERQSRMLLALNNLSKSILGKRDLFEIGWEIARNTAKQLKLEDCVVYIANQEHQILEQIAAFDNKLDENLAILNQINIPFGKGIVGEVYNTGKPIVVNDTSKDSRYIIDDKSRLSELAVPIIANQTVIGVLDSEHSEKDYFKPEHLETFSNIANLASAQFNSAISLKKEMEAQQQKNQLLIELEKSNDELKNFAHVVSHDLKSPLRSMSAIIAWIMEDNEEKFDQKTQNNLDLLLNKMDKMDHLINGILKYSSIDKIDHLQQEVDFNKVIQEILQILHIPEHIVIEIRNPLPTLKNNKFKIQQLFQNLISNAIKYNDKEKGVVTIDVSEKESSYLFLVQDNGIGIDKKYHKKIFDVFETLEETSNESNGIGLSIVKKIVDVLQGNIWLESEPRKGTTFFIELKK